jgi:hypothetical protein
MATGEDGGHVVYRRYLEVQNIIWVNKDQMYFPGRECRTIANHEPSESVLGRRTTRRDDCHAEGGGAGLAVSFILRWKRRFCHDQEKSVGPPETIRGPRPLT